MNSETDTQGGQENSATGDFEAFEEKIDELNEGLLEAYAAGFKRAKYVYGIDQGPDQVRDLMKNEGVSESHYYYWDGRTKPLEFWLREQFGLDADPVQNDEHEEEETAKRDWKCQNCGYRPRLIHVDEPVDSCSICAADEWSLEPTENNSKSDGGDV